MKTQTTPKTYKMRSFFGAMLILCVCPKLVAQSAINAEPSTSIDSALITTSVNFANTKINSAIYSRTSLSYSSKLYMNLDNVMIIGTTESKTRTLFVTHNYNSTQLSLVENWRPISRHCGLEYTLMTAADSGAYVETEEKNSERYIDNKSIFWKREFTINPKVAQDFMFFVYEETDSANISVGYIVLKALPFPTPIYNFEFPNERTTVNRLLSIDSLRITNLQDFTSAHAWFDIKQYTLTIFGSNNLALYRETIRSSVVPDEAKKKFRRLNVGDYIVIENITTSKMINTYYKIEII